jgi:hypothetical protein
MTKDEIIEMAKQAEMIQMTIGEWWGVELSDIEHFAKLVAEKEREACVKACEEVWLDTVEAQTHNDKCVKAIRAMGQA